jgi:hypothetical protein
MVAAIVSPNLELRTNEARDQLRTKASEVGLTTKTQDALELAVTSPTRKNIREYFS